jgi:hypothetical protein
MPHKDLKFALALIAIIVVVIAAALIYAQQTAPTYSSPTPQPSATSTPAPTESSPPTTTEPETTASPTTSQTPQATQSPTNTPAPSATTNPDLTQQQIRDAIINYTKTNHNETKSYLQSLTWTGGPVQTGGLGSGTYSWQSGNWNLTLTYPVVPNPLYSITLNASPVQSSVVYYPTVTWTGTWQDGVISETSYSFT